MVVNGDIQGLPFEKIEGCGNDFILLEQDPPPGAIDLLCDRHHGIGADGIMIFRGCIGNRVRLDHLDPDGGFSFCINGLRSALFCLFRKGLVADHGVAESQGVNVTYTIDQNVAFLLPVRPVQPLAWSGSGQTVQGFFADVGNPHFITRGPWPPEQWSAIAPVIRADTECFPEGVNVSLIWEVVGGWRIKTYERGVEGFTKACGSAVYASALMLLAESRRDSLRFLPDGRGWLQVETKGADLLMTGSAQWIASGVWRCGG